MEAREMNQWRKLVRAILRVGWVEPDVQAVVLWAKGLRACPSLYAQYKWLAGLEIEGFAQVGPRVGVLAAWAAYGVASPAQITDATADGVAQWIMTATFTPADAAFLAWRWIGYAAECGVAGRVLHALDRGKLFDGRFPPYITAREWDTDAATLEEANRVAVNEAITMACEHVYRADMPPVSDMLRAQGLDADTLKTGVDSVQGVRIATVLRDCHKRGMEQGKRLLLDCDKEIRGEAVERALQWLTE